MALFYDPDKWLAKVRFLVRISRNQTYHYRFVSYRLNLKRQSNDGRKTSLVIKLSHVFLSYLVKIKLLPITYNLWSLLVLIYTCFYFKLRQNFNSRQHLSKFFRLVFLKSVIFLFLVVADTKLRLVVGSWGWSMMVESNKSVKARISISAPLPPHFLVSTQRHRDPAVLVKNLLCSIPWNIRLHLTLFARYIWVLHIAKVVYFFLPSLPNVEWLILGPLLFFFDQKLFIFRFLENCFWGPDLHDAVG